MKLIETRRIVLTAAASSLLALGVPGVASAAHGKLRHGAHHPGSHARHGKRAHLVKFGAATTSAGNLGSTSGSTGAPVNAPAVPPANSTPSSETAGTVASFANGVLTITLGNGSTVSGQITGATELHCQPATPPASASGEDQGDSGEQMTAENGGHGDSAQSREQGDESHQGDGGESQDGEGSDDQSAQSCDTTALVAGAVVREAELSISGSGAVWARVDLIH
jgi:hypothetical protein